MVRGVKKWNAVSAVQLHPVAGRGEAMGSSGRPNTGARTGGPRQDICGGNGSEGALVAIL